MSYDALSVELRSLELLYWFGKLAPRDVNFSNVAAVIDATGRLGKVDAPMMIAYSRRTHLPALMEVVFVRTVSVLEVFLVDSLKTLFLERPDLFHEKGEVVEFQTSEVLSSSSIAPLKAKILTRLSRRLQNQGFEELVKFYRKLGVIFEQSGVSPLRLNEVHDRRHLLVHRLGKTDAVYRHKYNVTSARLTVDEAYLLGSLTDVRELCRFVNARLRKLAQDKRPPQYDPRGLRVRVELAAIGQRVAKDLAPDRVLSPGPPAICVRDVVASEVGDDKEKTLVLAGPTGVVRRLLRGLRKRAQKGHVALQSKVVLSRAHDCRLNDGQVRLVSERLPAWPLPKDIHKTIAMELALSHGDVEKAIALILDAPGVFGWPRKQPSK